MSILPPRNYEDEDERKLASVIDELSGKILTAVDAACRLRTAPGDAKRHRQYVKRNLEEAASNAMAALSYSKGD